MKKGGITRDTRERTQKKTTNYNSSTWNFSVIVSKLRKTVEMQRERRIASAWHP